MLFNRQHAKMYSFVLNLVTFELAVGLHKKDFIKKASDATIVARCSVEFFFALHQSIFDVRKSDLFGPVINQRNLRPFTICNHQTIKRSNCVSFSLFFSLLNEIWVCS